MPVPVDPVRLRAGRLGVREGTQQHRLLHLRPVLSHSREALRPPGQLRADRVVRTPGGAHRFGVSPPPVRVARERPPTAIPAHERERARGEGGGRQSRRGPDGVHRSSAVPEVSVWTGCEGQTVVGGDIEGSVRGGDEAGARSFRGVGGVSSAEGFDGIRRYFGRPRIVRRTRERDLRAGVSPLRIGAAHSVREADQRGGPEGGVGAEGPGVRGARGRTEEV